jgi:hypothetical protein
MVRQAQRYLVVVLLACHMVAPLSSLLLFLLYQQENKLELQSLEIISAAPRLDTSQDAGAQKKIPTRHEKLQKARKMAGHFRRRWKHAAPLPPSPFPRNDDSAERPSGLARKEFDDSPDAKVRCCCIACLSLGISFFLTSFVSFVPTGGRRGVVILTISA